MYYYVFVILLYVFLRAPLFSQWSGNAGVNTSVVTTSYEETKPVLMTYNGGTVIFFITDRNFNDRICIEFLDANGIVRWYNPTYLTDTTQNQSDMIVVSDRRQGAYVAWSNGNNIFATRITFTDTGIMRPWGRNGVLVCGASGTQRHPKIAVDSLGYLMVAWEDKRSGSVDIYAQRFSFLGTPLWSENGIAVVTAGVDQKNCVVGHAYNTYFFLWNDGRPDGSGIYAQRVSLLGEALWQVNGILVAYDDGVVSPIRCVFSNNSFFVTWIGMGTSTNQDIFVKKITLDGIALWSERLIQTGTERTPTLVSYNVGLFPYLALVFQKGNGSGDDIMMARIHADSGYVDTIIVVTSAFEDQDKYTLVVQDTIITIAWADTRFGGSDIYAQSCNLKTFTSRWSENGIPISIAGGTQTSPWSREGTDGSTIIVWEDTRNGGIQSDLYAQRVRSDGSLGGIVTYIEEVSRPFDYTILNNYPNPFNPITTIKFSLHTSAHVTLSVYDLRGVIITELYNHNNVMPGDYYAVWDATHYASGVYIAQLTINNAIYFKKLVMMK